ncbi:MAG: TetR/AcrR family transcriptional regulator [Actinomycetota bacterium]
MSESQNKQQQRTERSTNALLQAASELIVEGGFDALTFAAIGERAGYSRGLVTARFGSKDGLVDALIDRIVTTWNTRNVLPRTQGLEGRAAMVQVIEAIRRQAERDPSGLRVLYALAFEAIGPHEELRLRMLKLHEGMRADFAAVIRRGRRDGSIPRSISDDREAELIIAGLRGIGFQWLLDPGGFDPLPALAYLRDTTEERLTP